MSNEKNLTPELLEKAKSATSAAALLALAQENGIPLTAEEATLYIAQLHPKAGALSNEELDNVSGGCGEQSTKELAGKYVFLNYCNKPPKCIATRVTSVVEKGHYYNNPKNYGKLCQYCGYRGEIDRHCREMNWPILESAPPMEYLF